MNYPVLIKTYRYKNFLTQEDFAKLVGVSFATVNRWENGHFNPTMKTKKKLNDLFIGAKLIKGIKE